MLNTLLNAFSGPGGVFMVVITALGAFSIAVAIERGVLLLWRWRSPQDVVEARLRRGALAEAAAATAGTPVGAVIAAGAAEQDPEAAWEAMGAEAAMAEARLRRRIGALGAVANLSTMIGLLGTVYGLILAFSALGDATAGERAVRLSEGISSAMATTAWGLMVGIPSLGLHAWFEGVVSRHIARIESAAGLVALALRRPSSEG
jgi:biopolymer transport protein ExbB